jgi:hypothetical protein
MTDRVVESIPAAPIDTAGVLFLAFSVAAGQLKSKPVLFEQKGFCRG